MDKVDPKSEEISGDFPTDKHEGSVATFSLEDEKRIVRKIDWK